MSSRVITLVLTAVFSLSSFQFHNVVAAGIDIQSDTTAASVAPVLRENLNFPGAAAAAHDGAAGAGVGTLTEQEQRRREEVGKEFKWLKEGYESGSIDIRARGDFLNMPSAADEFQRVSEWPSVVKSNQEKDSASLSNAGPWSTRRLQHRSSHSNADNEEGEEEDEQEMEMDAAGEGKLTEEETLLGHIAHRMLQVPSLPSVNLELPGGIVITNITTILTTKTLLSEDCSNKLCLFYASMMSCSAQGLALAEICPKYLMGYLLACPIFPPPEALFTAPSVCGAQLVDFLGLLQDNGGLQAFIASYMTKMQDNCELPCMRRLVSQAHDFYDSCHAPLQNATIKNIYPFAFIFELFQGFRNLACTFNEQGENCYQVLTDYQAATGNSATNPDPNLLNYLDYSCNYYNISSTQYDQAIATQNLNVLKGACAKAQAHSCCLPANGLALVASAQYSQSSPYIMPPCMLQYLYKVCPGLNFTDFCNNGSVANITTMLVSTTMDYSAPGSGQRILFPNMYNASSVLELQGLITTALSDFFNLGAEPFYFTVDFPFNIEVISYTYGKGPVQFTPSNGSMYYPPMGDYERAVSSGGSGTFVFQVVVYNLNSTEQEDILLAAFQNPLFSAILGIGATGALTGATVTALTEPVTKYAMPLPFPPLDAASRSSSLYLNINSVSLLSAVVLSVMLTLVQRK